VLALSEKLQAKGAGAGEGVMNPLSSYPSTLFRAKKRKFGVGKLFLFSFGKVFRILVFEFHVNIFHV
jgi:hypothetical protein